MGRCFPDDWLVALWGDDRAVQRGMVHSEGRPATGSRTCPNRNLLAHSPKHLHEELSNHYRDMIHADTAAEVETPHKGSSGKPSCLRRMRQAGLRTASRNGPGV